MSAPSGPRRVTHLLWRLSATGGVQTVVRSLADAVEPERIALSVVTVRSVRTDDRLDEVPVPVDGLGFDGARLRPWTRVVLMARAARAVRVRRAEVVHLHSGTVWLGLLAGGLSRRRRVLVEVHDAPGSGRHGRWTDRFEGWFVRLTGAAVVCHSEAVARAVRDRWSVKSARVHTFPLSVDTSRFRPRRADERAATRSRWGVAADAYVIGVTGRLVASKRVTSAARAVVALVGDVGSVAPVLVLAGDGPERDRGGALMTAAGGVCITTGSLAADEMAEVVGAFDVVLSASEYEGFGLTLAEAMACGVPVVATAVGGVGDVVRDGETGLLVPLGDEQAMADALRRFRDEPDLRRAFGERGAEHGQRHFVPTRLADAFSRCYEEIAR